MIVKSLSVANFRNYNQEKVTFSENTNVIYGKNAQGKTNLLEAIWLFSGGHSFRGSKENELTKIGCKNPQAPDAWSMLPRSQQETLRLFLQVA